MSEIQKYYLILMFFGFFACWFFCYKVSGDSNEAFCVSMIATLVSLQGFPQQ